MSPLLPRWAPYGADEDAEGPTFDVESVVADGGYVTIGVHPDRVVSAVAADGRVVDWGENANRDETLILVDRTGEGTTAVTVKIKEED